MDRVDCLARRVIKEQEELLDLPETVGLKALKVILALLVTKALLFLVPKDLMVPLDLRALLGLQEHKVNFAYSTV